ncbi:MAG: S8 family serine peptidase [Bacillota bacterium]
MFILDKIQTRPYTIQCSGRIGLNERHQMEILGLLLNEYIGENTFLVSATEDQINAVKNLAFVKSIAPVEKENKLSGSLSKKLEDFKIHQHRGSNRFILKMFENSGADAIVSFVLKNEGVVSGHDSQWLEVELEYQFIDELSGFPEVVSIEEAGEYELLNDRAGEIIKAPSVWNEGFTGSGQIIGISDTGIDTGILETLHPDFQNRITAIFSLGRANDASDFHGHGTHVAGSALGSGTASESRIRGMAPESSLVFQSIMDKNGGLSGIPGDLSILLNQAYQSGARIYNMSWGTGVRGLYNYTAAQADKFVWENKDIAIVAAAGNIGREGSIYSPAVAKNVIAVGASENNRPNKGSIADNPAQIAFFSSRGPAADGRFKPDLSAPGTWILSARSSLAPDSNFWGVESQYYAYNGGTSMSSPIVAGFLALIREYFTRVEGVTPSAALLKAAIINGAFILPGYTQNEEGQGRINAPDHILNTLNKYFFVDQKTKLATGEEKIYEYTLDQPAGELKATLVWTDYPAGVNASKALVNDLDLSLISPSGQVFYLDDHLNNVEQLAVPNPEAGTYKIKITGHHVPMGYQDYALVISSGGSVQPDQTSPAVHITRPQNNSQVEGIITITADPSDNVAVTRVEFYLDNGLLGTSSSPPYEVILDTNTLANRSYNITAKAYDSAGNWGQDTITVNVNNTATAPEVKITWPLSGVVLKGIIKFRADVRSEEPLANITFLAQDKIIKTYDYSKMPVSIKQVSPYITLDTTKYPNGGLELKVKACDKKNSCTESPVYVTISNP